eukprot:2122402-Amphidinium_carterae.1
MFPKSSSFFIPCIGLIGWNVAYSEFGTGASFPSMMYFFIATYSTRWTSAHIVSKTPSPKSCAPALRQ